MSLDTIIRKSIDTTPQNPGEVSRFNSDINQRFSVMKSVREDPNSPARKWLAKRQIMRAKQTYGDSGVGRDQMGRPVYKTCAAARNGTEWNGSGTVFKADGFIRTIYDLIDLNYNFFPQAMGKTQGLNKADDPILTTTQGVHNDVYGQDVFALLNSEQNVFGVLETRPWTKSGERIITSFASGGDAADGSGGVNENAELTDTIKPEFDTYATDPATVLHTFDVSQVEQLLAATDDDTISDDPFALLRSWFGEGLPDQQQGGGEHGKQINVQLCSDLERDESADSTFEYAFETLDRALSNKAEADNCLTTAADANIYGFDRSAGEFESNVIENGGNTQVFHLDILDEMIRKIKENSDWNPQQSPEDFFFLTGHDTYQRIEDEMGGKERIETVRATTGVNGVQTEPGNDVGVAVSTYKGIPIIEANDIVKDGISRLYLIHKGTLWNKMLLPTQFYSTGTEVGDGPFPLGRLGNEGAFVTIGQLTLKNPVNHCKARDLE